MTITFPWGILIVTVHTHLHGVWVSRCSLTPLTSWEHERYRRRSLNQGLRRIHFAQPRNFVAGGVGVEDFDRLSVAHGLSMGAETLMKITAKEASDRQWTPR
jgi:hypothetical protein